MTTQMPKYWYFPTNDDEVVIRCEYNPSDQQYNIGCTPVKRSSVPQRVAIEMTRLSNAIDKYV